MKYSIKNLIKVFVYQLWKLNGRKLWLRRGDAIALAYHRVLDENDTKLGDPIALPVHVLVDQLLTLKKYFTIISLENFFDLSKYAREKSRHLCIITFDDGWIDSYTVALPLLKKYSIPATFFITTGYTDTYRQFWWHFLTEILRKYQSIPHSFQNSIYNKLLLQNISIPNFDQLSDDTLIEWCKTITHKERCEFINNFSKVLGYMPVERQAMTKNELQKLVESSYTIGSHTVNHIILPFENYEDVALELAKSLSFLKKISNKLCNYFAYPNGDYSSRDIELVKKAGYQCAFTMNPGIISADKVNYFELPRICADNKNSDELLFSIFKQSLKRYLKMINLQI